MRNRRALSLVPKQDWSPASFPSVHRALHHTTAPATTALPAHRHAGDCAQGQEIRGSWGDRGFLPNLQMVVSKPELQNCFRTFPVKVEFSKPGTATRSVKLVLWAARVPHSWPSRLGMVFQAEGFCQAALLLTTRAESHPLPRVALLVIS